MAKQDKKKSAAKTKSGKAEAAKAVTKPKSVSTG